MWSCGCPCSVCEVSLVPCVVAAVFYGDCDVFAVVCVGCEYAERLRVYEGDCNACVGDVRCGCSE